MNNNLTTLRRAVEETLGSDLSTAIGISNKGEAERLIEQFLHTIANRTSEHSLAQWIDPQWVILAGGHGTRIDPSGRLNKTLDLWFGESNTLQVSRSYLPGTRPHIIVVNPMMAERLMTTQSTCDGIIPSSALDMDTVNRLCGPNVILCVQPEQNGTGGALQAAIPAVQACDAEWIGVAFGDEPFLDGSIFLQTLVSHFVSGADATLCGKTPETVVDKGGLFFDQDGKFVGTKEWIEMTDEEKSEMSRRLNCGEGFTNTGITLIRSSAAIDRMNRLQAHGSKSELHHVDLIRYCYEDGLKTHAYINPGRALRVFNLSKPELPDSSQHFRPGIMPECPAEPWPQGRSRAPTAHWSRCSGEDHPFRSTPGTGLHAIRPNPWLHRSFHARAPPYQARVR